MTEQSRPIAYTLFCDDVRYERDSKCSAMGVYESALVVSERSVELPKFVAHTVVDLPADLAGNEGAIELLDRGNVLIRGVIDVPAEAVAAAPGAVLRASIPIEVAPFLAEAGMRLQVRLTIGSFTYLSGELPVLQGEQIPPTPLHQTFE